MQRGHPICRLKGSFFRDQEATQDARSLSCPKTGSGRRFRRLARGSRARIGPGNTRIDLRHGALLIHGNFCGPGNRGPNHPPIDALDAACARHDACTPPAGTLTRCSCNDRLSEEAGLVANDPATPEKVRQTAQFIADGALALPCDDD